MTTEHTEERHQKSQQSIADPVPLPLLERDNIPGIMGPGISVAHYRITSKLGEGGMGEVWRAADTKLGREVAVKILPALFAEDASRMARFAREARTLASLNHPNIAGIYGVEERALIMELVEGPTLCTRIAEGPLPFDEALRIALQIAAALEHAHDKGVIHRDLKPANIKVTSEGRVKVLDFGLAKAMWDNSPNGPTEEESTVTMRETAGGRIMGTPAYMSPEQAKGRPVDRRTDIWAFGVILVEMLTGRRLFSGGTASEVLAPVITSQPELGLLPAATPASILTLISRCLDRNAQLRLRDIGEARVALEKHLADPDADRPTAAAILPASRARSAWFWAAGVFAAATLVLGALLWRGDRIPGRPLMRFSAEISPDAVSGAYLTVAISPDGKRIVFPVRGNRLATRLLHESNATIVPGTEGGEEPFFSPDGGWIGFFADGKLKKAPVQGGAAFTVCDAAALRGASWSADGNIIANLDLVRLCRVSSAGGVPQIIARPESSDQNAGTLPITAIGDMTYRDPQILPDGQSVLFTAGRVGSFDDATLSVLKLGTGQIKPVHRGGYCGRYLPTGHLIYIHQDTLFAIKFDLAHLETRGAPAPFADQIASNPGAGTAQLDVATAASGPGTVVYLIGLSGRAQPLVWLDATGGTAPLFSGASVITPRLSPDGKLVALSTRRDIAVYDPRSQALTQITFTAGSNTNPVWTPDGKHIVYACGGDIWWTRANGSAQPERILKGNTALPGSFSPDGTRLAFSQVGEYTGRDVWALPLDVTDPEHPKPGSPEVLVQTSESEMDPAFSPDGKWLAYTSSEAGSVRVYVRPSSRGEGKWRISTTSTGRFPIWSRNGRELFYETIDGHIMAAEYTAKEGVFSALQPHPWCDIPIQVTGPYPNFDLAPDGKRLVVVIAPTDSSSGEKRQLHAVFLVNFFDELKRRLP